MAYDDRILGSGDFVQRVLDGAEEREKETLRLRSTIPDLHTLAERIALGEGVEVSELRSGGKSREVVRARKLFSRIAVRDLGYSGAEVARYLGVTTSAVNRAASGEAPPEVERYL
jgi:putative transposase